VTDNLAIWNAVSKTNPAHTKKVNQRGGFTAISAQYQILAATEQFGPIGIGWGYVTGDPIIVETLITVPVSLWHGSRENVFGPMLGCEEWKDKNGRIDSDAPKKAVTDGLTKLLSQLGFNADVFLGLFDDNKYVERVTREFAEQGKPPAEMPDTEWAHLVQLVEAAKADTTAMLKHYGVKSLRHLNQNQYGHAVDSLNAKLAAMAKAETDTKAKENG
jgi:hypothetical protein